MSTRHQIDTSVTFDPEAKLPPERTIEDPDAPLTRSSSKKKTVEREIYVASKALAEVVNLAIALGRPLLLQGDPGCGKTRLANAIAYALALPLEQSYIKSTTKAQDLLYTYDAVARLYDAQLNTGSSKDKNKRPDIARYIRFGPLGRAIMRAGHGRRSVVLIDEIDKADLDFPNDLLHELDRLEFSVAESPDLSYRIDENRPDLRPIIVVTHNEEKALPTAFLRRCVFHYVKFPDDPAQLQAILGGHKITQPELRQKAIDIVSRLRGLNLLKKPGLSELLDWAGYLQAAGIDPAALDQNLPAAQALLKTREDLQRAEKEFAPAQLE